MSKLTSVFRGKSKGIGLIETMIAILLLGMVALAFLSGISTASIAILLSDEHSTAQSLALSQMEYVKNQKYKTAPSGGVVTYNKTTEIPGYFIKSVNRTSNTADAITGIPWNTDNSTASNNDTGIQMVTIIIYHPYDAGNPADNVLTLEDYKVDR